MNGVAIRSTLAPALAKVFITRNENDFINKPSNPLKILFYYRFVDILLFIKMKMKKNFFKYLILFITI